MCDSVLSRRHRLFGLGNGYRCSEEPPPTVDRSVRYTTDFANLPPIGPKVLVYDLENSVPSRAGVAIVAGVLLLTGSGGTVSAQLVVYDGATTARNTVTAALNQYLFETERLQHMKLRDMARRLSALTSLRKFVMEDVPRWRTHGGDYFYAQPYNDALIFGDPSGGAFTELSQRLLADPGLLNRLGPSARRAVEASLATVNAADAAAIAATQATGQLRLFGRKNELPAIDALEGDVVDSSSEQSTAAVLDKISGATLIGARQRQARIQLLVGMVEQLLVDSKRARDTDTAALTMQMTSWRDGKAAGEAFVAGSGDALRTWRQP